MLADAALAALRLPLSCGTSAPSFEHRRRPAAVDEEDERGSGTRGLPVVLSLGKRSSANFEHASSCVVTT